MGRKRIANPKDVQIRITRADKRGLALFKIDYNLPIRYDEADIVHALLVMMPMILRDNNSYIQ